MELIDSRQLRAFQELARQESFTAAARHLHLSQSAISHSIKALERTLDTTLFERLGKSVRLTSAGESLVPHANRILATMQRAHDDIMCLSRPGHGRLRIGATVTISQYLLPPVLRELRESFPAYEMTVITKDTRQLLRLLESNDIDLAIGIEVPESSRHHFRPMFCDHIAMAMAPVHPLAANAAPNAFDLTQQNFIFYSRDSETFRILERQFNKLKGRVHDYLQVGSMAAIKEMAKIGMGIGLLTPWIALEEITAGSLVFRPLPWRKTDRTWGLYTDHHHQPKMIDDVFFGICQNVARSLQLRTEKGSTTLTT
jgi:DNA-binding transcriptional LysR family regulator